MLQDYLFFALSWVYTLFKAGVGLSLCLESGSISKSETVADIDVVLVGRLFHWRGRRIR